MIIKKKHNKLLILYSILFSLLVITRIVMESAERVGGVWNLIQVALILSGIITYIYYIKNYDLNNPTLNTFLLFGLYIWILSFISLPNLSFSNLYYFLVVPFGPMVMLLFYYLGVKSNIKTSSWIYIISFFIIAYLVSTRRVDYFTMISESKGMVANAYYVIGLLPLVLVFIKSKYRVIPFVIAVIVVLLSGKRAGMLAAALMIIFYFTSFSIKEFKKTLRSVIGLSLIMIIVYYVFTYLNSSFELNTLNRLQSLETDGGSGRDVRWKAIINTVSNSNIINFLFGHGHRSTAIYFRGDAHNDFLQVLFEYGLFALFLYISFFTSLLRSSYLMFKTKYPYAKNFFISIIAALFLAMFSFFIIEPRYITAIAITWGLLLADWYKFKKQKKWASR